MASNSEKEDAQIRILKIIQSEEINKKWDGKVFAPDLKWKRSTISDVIILQELENVREENKTMIKQVNDLKKDQDELISLVRQMREEILDKKQDQNNTEKESNDGPSQENKGGKQRPQTRKANDWNGGKGGSKKPKNTGDPPPGSREYADSKNNADANSGEGSREENKIKRVKTVLNAE